MATKAVRAEQEPVLSRGSTGTAVREWQTIVTYVLGEDSIVVDGRFGPATAAATRQVQQMFDLDTDGVVGPLTWSATRVVHAPVNPGDVTGGHAPVDPGAVSGVGPATAVSAVGHLEVGDRGERVRLWQHMLDGDPRSTSATVADGVFGPKTLAATRAFQQRYGLVVDGIVGPRTRATMQDVRDDV
ncbi:peptidoglycan-binding protein [Jannaschia sp. R86511]|uniref:peptidoglycan-binding domain-containing protein n=1 Tax=Jannaschia sp. R86511 TaxID=3093853 RepID=UPI0036D394F8